MSETTGAAGGAVQISLNPSDFNSALVQFNSRIGRLKDVIGSISAPEAPAGSPVITEFAEALNELITVAGSISELLTTDAAAYESAYDAKIEQDNNLSGRIGGTH